MESQKGIPVCAEFVLRKVRLQFNCISPFLKKILKLRTFYCRNFLELVKHLNMHFFFQRVTKNPKYRTISFIAVSLLLIIYLNWSVCKTAKSQVEQLALLIGNASARSNNIQQAKNVEED